MKQSFRATAENVAKNYSSLFEKKMITDPVTGQKNWKIDTNVISVATINQALGNSFEINNLDSAEYAEKLALHTFGCTNYLLKLLKKL